MSYTSLWELHSGPVYPCPVPSVRPHPVRPSTSVPSVHVRPVRPRPSRPSTSVPSVRAVPSDFIDMDFDRTSFSGDPPFKILVNDLGWSGDGLVTEGNVPAFDWRAIGHLNFDLCQVTAILLQTNNFGPNVNINV